MNHFHRGQMVWIFILISVNLFASPYAVGKEKNTYPKQVISLGPIITENIYLLGAQEKLIGNTTYCVVPEAAQHIEKVGTLIQMNVEKIIRLNPDLVLASSFTKPKQIQILEKFGISVIRFENPKTYDEICEMTMKIGRILGKEETARNITRKTREQVAMIQKQTAGLKKKKVFFQIGIKPLHAPIRGTFVNEYIRFAGGINITENETSEKYSREKVLQLNPDVILIAVMGSSKKAAEHEKQIWMRFKSITASEKNEIHILDPDIVCSPTPVTFVEALNIIVRKLHPSYIIENE